MRSIQILVPKNGDSVELGIRHWVWVLAILLLVGTGIGFRAVASHLQAFVQIPVKLPVPLSDFPMKVGGWSGRDVPIPANIQRIARNDDFLNRLYKDNSRNLWVNVYIAYSARPRNMVGHQPEVCYVGGGWVHDSTQPSKEVGSSGMEIPCLLHRFHRPSPETAEMAVLNFYILNGQLTNDEGGFSGVGWRTPNIGGNPARYVCQVQISSVLENSVREATKDMTDLILDFLPDASGKVRAAEVGYVTSARTE
jgi:hypothetical protein